MACLQIKKSDGQTQTDPMIQPQVPPPPPQTPAPPPAPIQTPRYVDYEFRPLEFHEPLIKLNQMVVDAPLVEASRVKAEFDFATIHLPNESWRSQVLLGKLQLHVRVGAVSQEGRFSEKFPTACDIFVNAFPVKLSGQLPQFLVKSKKKIKGISGRI